MGFFSKNKNEKVFCIGRNKTGTTSVYKALEDFGYKMGNQRQAELLNREYAKRNWKPIIKYCKSAEAFQDIPFSLPYTFIVMDQYFPGSKFILTERESDEVWYDSFIRFQKKKHGSGSLPTLDVLKNNTYAYKGFTYDNKKLFFGTPDNDLYNKKIMINHYNYHSKMVKDYFKFKPEQLIKLNVSEENSYLNLSSFLNKEPLYKEFPWRNKT